MIELVKKTMLTGLGVASLTKEKVEEIAKDFVEKGKMSEQEGNKLVQELMEKSEESKEELKKQIDSMISRTITKMDIVTKSDLEKIREELEEIKSKISEKE